jgi:peptidoglycan/xylan/chitin deacetylase (PgdA/CDA1 family)
VRHAVAVLAVLLVPAGAAANVGDDASRGRGPGQVEVERLAQLGATVYCGGRTGRLVALTFDDGPSRYTRAVAAELLRARARGTFFLVGERLGYWPGALRAETSVGVLGDHTWSHAWLARLNARQLRAEVERTTAAEFDRTGRRVLLFRPPYGVRTAAADRLLRRLGMLQVLWDVDGTVGRIRPGSIVLLHDTRPETPSLVRAILAQLRRRGLRAVTVPELLANDPPRLVRDARGLRSDCR